MNIELKLGSKKGDSGKEIEFLNTFLNKYFDESKFLDGYLDKYFNYNFKYSFNKLNNRSFQLNSFDNNTEERLKVFQKEHKLKPTGILDKDSINLIKRPQCVTDISFPTFKRQSTFFRIVPQEHKLLGLGYKTNLNYMILNSSEELPMETINNIIKNIVRDVSSYSYFTFKEVEVIEEADIEISFQKHKKAKYPEANDPWVQNEVGKTYPPRMDYYNLKREVIINDNFNWTDNISLIRNDPRYYDVYAVLIHEFGHSLGLAHDQQHPEAIMWPMHVNLARKYVQDDVNGLRFIYDNILEIRKQLGLN